MKKYLLSFVILVSTFIHCFAEEGMLIPSLISAFESDMKAKGMKLSAKDIYDVNHSSLKDAIMHFGGGCTAELVSGTGLLLTNHHCGYSQVQSHSSLEHDYLKNGFWAKNHSEELSNPGLTASRMVRIDDVTASVLFGVNPSDNPMVREAAMRKNIEQLVKDAITGTHYEAEIKPFNYGNDYYIIVKEIFKDVRLVGTPQIQLESLVATPITGFGPDTLEIFQYLEYMLEWITSLLNIQKKMFPIHRFTFYQFHLKIEKQEISQWFMVFQEKQSNTFLRLI